MKYIKLFESFCRVLDEAEQSPSNLLAWVNLYTGKNYTEKRLAKISTIKISFKPDVTSIPEDIDSLLNLKTLILRDTEITKIPESIGNLKNLKTLEITGSKSLLTVPNSIGNLKTLEILNLTDNALKTIPNSVGKLSNLKELSLMQNKLTKLPNSVGKLQNLNELGISRNVIKKFPTVIYKLTNLKKLYIDDTTLPAGGETEIESKLPNIKIALSFT